MKAKKTTPQKQRRIFVKSFKHWRSGKIIRAEDYGLEAFCFTVRG